MTIAFDGTGGLFTRVGAIGGTLRNINGFLNVTTPDPGSEWGSGGPAIEALGINVNNIEAQFASTNQQLIDGLYTQRDAYRNAASGFRSYLKTLAQNTVIKQVDDDVGLVTRTLAEAMKQLIAQMVAEAEDVPAPTVSAGAASAGSGNNGTGACAASVIGPNGVNRHYIFDETLDLLCTVSSQEGATLRREQFTVRGDAAQPDVLAHDWPLGSGASISLNAVDASEDAGTNKLTNSDFDTFTSNTPGNWTVRVGVAGTDILEESSVINTTGGKSLEFIGTGGAPLSSVDQEFDDADGTTATLKPLTVYAFNCFLRKSATATGVLSFSLWDGSNVITDAAGTNNAATKDISTLSSSAFAAFSGFFRTPAALPDTIRFRVHLTTALNSGQSVYIDDLAFAEATEVYQGGPFLKIFGGATKFIKNDSFTIAINNAYDSAWQLLAERLFGMRSLGLQLPTDGSPTLADSLIA